MFLPMFLICFSATEGDRNAKESEQENGCRKGNDRSRVQGFREQLHRAAVGHKAAEQNVLRVVHYALRAILPSFICR